MKFVLSLIVLLSFNSIWSQSVIRGPYLQSPTHQSVILMWRTDVNANSKVWYGTDSTNLNLMVDDAAAIENHIMLLTGLQPSTKYYYQIGTMSMPFTADFSLHSFSTHPNPGETVDTRVWCIGDFGRANQGQVDVKQSYENWTGSRGTDVWLWLGDNAYNDGTDVQYQQKLFDVPGFSDVFSHVPFWPSPGNHDYNTVWSESTLLGIPYTNIPLADHKGPYYDLVEVPKYGEAGGFPSQLEVFYSFDFGDVHFLSLNSEVFDYTFTYDGIDAMKTWIHNDLQQNTRKFTIAYFHQPPYSKGSHDSDDAFELVMKAMREEVMPVIESYDVDLVVCGHSHVFERSYLISGHTGNSGSFNASHVMDGSNGNYDQGNAYIKDGSNGTAEGTVYVVCGNSGSSESSPTLDHPAMVFTHGGSGAMGSFVIDIHKNKLDGKYLRVDGTVQDEFSILKTDLQLSAVNDYSICEGDSLNIAAVYSGGSDSLSFTWLPALDDSSVAVLSPSSSNSYTLEVTDEVTGQVESVSFNITVFPFTNPTIVESSPGILEVTSGAGYSYQWLVNGNVIAGATTQFYQPMFDGDYTCLVTSNDGCVKETAFFIYSTVGIDDIEIDNLWIYPNPANEFITIGINHNLIDADYSIIDIQGKLVENGKFKNTATSLDISGLPQGTYLLKVFSEGSETQFSFTKQ